MSKSKKTLPEPPLLTRKQVGEKIHAYLTSPVSAAYLDTLELAKNSPVAALLDELALGSLVSIELNVPRDSKNEDAKRTLEYCALVRNAKTSMKANHWLREAAACAKDFMLWDDAILGEKIRDSLRQRRLGTGKTDHEEVRRFRARLVANGDHDATSQTAAKFEIGTRQVRNICNPPKSGRQ